ncbi:helix-turn-helix transcriptional regulator [Lelliottia amnigena]
MTNKTHPISAITPASTSVLNDQLVDMTFITTFCGVSDKWIYRQIQLGHLPGPIKLGRSSRWLKSEIEEWLQKRVCSR